MCLLMQKGAGTRGNTSWSPLSGPINCSSNTGYGGRKRASQLCLQYSVEPKGMATSWQKKEQPEAPSSVHCLHTYVLPAVSVWALWVWPSGSVYNGSALGDHLEVLVKQQYTLLLIPRLRSCLDFWGGVSALAWNPLKPAG